MPQYGVPQNARSMSLVNTAVNLIASGSYLIKGIYIWNGDSDTRYVKLYSKQSATGASDTPVITIGVPTMTGTSVGLEEGLFKTDAGLSARSVTQIGDTGATGSADNTVICTIFYSKL